MNKNMLRLTLMVSVFLVITVAAHSQKKLFVLGSSTSACWGVSSPANCYLTRLANHYNLNGQPVVIENRAVAGFNVYKSMPLTYRPPAGRDLPTPYYTITDALAANPDVILVNYPSNNYEIYSVAEVMFCLRTIKEQANKAGKPLYVTTAQPRTSFDAAGREKLRILKDSILHQFGAAAVDFYTGIADPQSLAIATPYQVPGDPIHLNDEAHNVLFQRLLAKNIFAARQSPVANAGKDETLPEGQATVLHGENSSASGGIKSFLWTKISGPSAYEILTPTEASTWIRNMVAGVYTYRLTVTDSHGGTAFDDVVITVTTKAGALLPPAANAGKDETITVGQATVLHGENSSAPGGSIKSYLWTKIAGPATYEILSPTEPSTWIRNMVAGIYTFRLTITDNNGLTAFDDVNITVQGQVNLLKPIADAGKDETIPEGQATVLQGANSSAPGGTIKSYSWSKFSGPSTYELLTPNASGTWVRNLTVGSYVFRLTVTDNNGATAYDDVTINVVGLAAPTANAGPDLQVTLPVSSIILDGRRSTTSSGYITRYNWKFASGPLGAQIISPDSAVTKISNLVQGVYTFRLTVMNTLGVTAIDDVVVSAIGQLQLAPILTLTANAGKDETIPVGQATVLHGEFSSAQSGSITRYEWMKYAGPATCEILTPNAATTWIRNMTTGTYVYRLTVTDDKGNKAIDDVVITVTATVINMMTKQKRTHLDLRNMWSTVNEAGFRLYPNPAINHLNIEFHHQARGEGRILLSDARGRLIREVRFFKDREVFSRQIPVNGLTPGLYTVEVLLGREKINAGKFYKK
jgi:hypothetical protein